MARKTKAQKAAEAEIRRVARVEAVAAAKEERTRNEQLGVARQIDALLWQCVDKSSEQLFKLMTGGADDIASYRVRGRVPTAVTICYDDGYTYHVDRRLGGLQTRPVILEFEHSDPAHVGTVHAAIRFRTGDGPSNYEAFDLQRAKAERFDWIMEYAPDSVTEWIQDNMDTEPEEDE